MSALPAKILLASDGSEDAAVAARAAIDVSGRTGAELHVVHAWDTPVPTGYTGRPLPSGASIWHQKQAEELLAAQVERIERAGGGPRWTRFSI